MRRRLLTLLPVPLLLMAGAASGCGVTVPTDATEDDFCAAVAGLDEVATGSESEQAGQARDVGSRMAEVGTPVATPAKAREGFLVQVDLLRGADDAPPDRDDLSAFQRELLDEFTDFRGDCPG